MRANIFIPGVLGAGVGLALLACAAGELNLPNDGAPVQLTAVSGAGQEAKVGTPLPEPLVAQVTDAAQAPVPNVPVVFRFEQESPEAEIDPASPVTDSMGRASVRVRLGTMAGTQTIEAILASSAAAEARATFDVTALEKAGRHEGDDNSGNGNGGDDSSGRDNGKRGRGHQRD